MKSKAMTPTAQETAKACYVIYQNLPAEVQKAIKEMIAKNQIIEKENTPINLTAKKNLLLIY